MPRGHGTGRKKSLVEFAMKNKNSNCIAWENITQGRFLQEINNVQILQII